MNAENMFHGKFFGMPEVRDAAVKNLTESLLFAISHDRSGAFVIAGPPRVGKTSAVQQLEEAIRAYGLPYGTGYSRANAKASRLPEAQTLLFDEIAIQDSTHLKRMSAVLNEGRRIVLDVVNRHFKIGDPRNNSEISLTLPAYIPYEKLYLRQLYAVQPEFAIAAKISGRFSKNVDLKKIPELTGLLKDHQSRVQRSTQDYYFVAGETFIDEYGNLVTQLIWTGKERYGSVDGQEITTKIDPKYLK